MTTIPRFSIYGRGVCVLIAMFALSCAAVAALYSQEPHPAATPAQPPSQSQDAPTGSTGSDSCSALETPSPVRFATGAAITVLEDTPLQVINDMPISSRTTKTGARIAFTVTRDVIVDGILVIPCGATVYGTVVAAKQAGRLIGASNLTLKFTALNLNGRSYPLYAPSFKVVGQSKTRPTTEKIAAGAGVGAAAMDIRIAQLNPDLTEKVTGGERAFGDSVAAGLGAGVGTAIAAGSPPSIALIPAESQMEFTLASPIAVYPVDQRTAARLAQGLHLGGPVLYVRGENQ
jgi:hypothetical protein